MTLEAGVMKMSSSPDIEWEEAGLDDALLLLFHRWKVLLRESVDEDDLDGRDLVASFCAEMDNRLRVLVDGAPLCRQ
jgi:hypothetical protein